MKKGMGPVVLLLIAMVFVSCPVPLDPPETPESSPPPPSPPVNPPSRWQIAAPGSVAGGSITADKTTAEAGEIVTVTILRSSGQYLNSISVTGAVLSENEASENKNTRIFKMPPMDVAVSGSFAAFLEPRFVAVGTGNIAAYSVDGKSWAASMMMEGSAWEGVAYGGKKFVAVASAGDNDSTYRTAYSENGIEWKEEKTPSLSLNTFFSGLAYGGGVFTAVTSLSGGRIICSADGIHWEDDKYKWKDEEYAPFTSAHDIAYGDGKFVMIAQASGNNAAWSADGVTWTRTAIPGGSNWRSVAWGGGRFVAVDYSADSADSSGVAAYSDDGSVWTVGGALPEGYHWAALAYDGDNEKFAAAGEGDNTVLSPDGDTWTAGGALPGGYRWTDMAWGGGKLVAVGENGSAAWSEDAGLTWTVTTMPRDINWRSVTYGTP
ncbi:MAG: hypothetical protein LBJ90_02855 [Treponema sp.]|jgi:hypothetical protein|nr:hypothetical protein [Treponema sp.]